MTVLKQVPSVTELTLLGAGGQRDRAGGQGTRQGPHRLRGGGKKKKAKTTTHPSLFSHEPVDAVR